MNNLQERNNFRNNTSRIGVLSTAQVAKFTRQKVEDLRVWADCESTYVSYSKNLILDRIGKTKVHKKNGFSFAALALLVKNLDGETGPDFVKLHGTKLTFTQEAITGTI